MRHQTPVRRRSKRCKPRERKNRKMRCFRRKRKNVRLCLHHFTIYFHFSLLTLNNIVVASLNTRLNAVRTLESRVSLIKSYISALSTTEETPDQNQKASKPSSELLSHPHLRNINSLLSNLSLLTPPEQSAFSAESLAQTNDVLLVSLLGQLGQSVKDMRELGRKAAIVNNVRQSMGMASRKGGKAARLESEFLSGREGPAGMFA